MTANSTSDPIPSELLKHLNKGDCVLFLGADLPLDYPGAPPSRPELARALAEAYGLPAGLPWPETCQAYLGRFPNDRHGLISFVRARCSGPGVQPGPLHRAVADAGFRVIVTAWYDELTEIALREAGYRVNRVARDTQLPYAGEGKREAIVVKLYGCASDPESLALTPWDVEELMYRLPRKLEVVTAFCALRPPFLAGFDPADRMPMRLYVHASANLAQHMRRAYVVWEGDTAAAEAAWQGKNVALIRAEAAALLAGLASQMPAAAAARAAIHVSRPPYKFLDYYTPGDADLFCGRDVESQVVTRLALEHRLLTLFGPSGAGKTSLLLAGVVPRLAAEGYRHVYVRALDDPLAALRKALARQALHGDPEAGADLAAFLAQAIPPDGRWLAILDQFEELFLRVGSRQRDAFFAELGAVVADPPAEVRFILSLREDFLARLDEARPWLPDVLGTSYRLDVLNRGNARLAITEPAARAGVRVDPKLVDALVGAEGRAGAGQAGDLAQTDGRVPPAALQIVVDRLYRAALPAGHPADDPPPPGVALTVGRYRTFQYRPAGGDETLYGARAILAGYVADGLARLPQLAQEDGAPLAADPALGREILKAMVTGQRTKAALTHAEIVALLDEAGAIRCADPADCWTVEATRLGLERVRLLRGFERDGAALYELAHDHLAAEIATWIGQEELAGRLARELLGRELDNWRHNRLLIPQEALRLIHERRDQLKRLSADELGLLLRSALAHGFEVPTWFERAGAAGVPADAIALEGLGGASFRTRAAAVTALAGLGERFAEPLLPMLADLYPQVRAAAIAALERLRPDGGWRGHLKYECFVPAGEFIMGEGNEAHSVPLDAFYIGKYPVTNAEYARFMADRERGFEMPRGKEQHPVVNVSWYDAKEYAEWAGIRLPTEAEWEKAASWDTGMGGRGDAEMGRRGEMARERKRKRKYPWGDTFDKRKCNTAESGIGGTTPVGQYSPAGDSPCGCADMAGNVWEWCSSLYEAYPYRADDGREDPTSSGERVLRGGSWHNGVGLASALARARDWTNLRDDYDGFRVVVAGVVPFSSALWRSELWPLMGESPERGRSPLSGARVL